MQDIISSTVLLGAQVWGIVFRTFGFRIRRCDTLSPEALNAEPLNSFSLTNTKP